MGRFGANDCNGFFRCKHSSFETLLRIKLQSSVFQTFSLSYRLWLDVVGRARLRGLDPFSQKHRNASFTRYHSSSTILKHLCQQPRGSSDNWQTVWLIRREAAVLYDGAFVRRPIIVFFCVREKECEYIAVTKR